MEVLPGDTIVSIMQAKLTRLIFWVHTVGISGCKSVHEIWMRYVLDACNYFLNRCITIVADSFTLLTVCPHFESVLYSA